MTRSALGRAVAAKKTERVVGTHADKARVLGARALPYGLALSLGSTFLLSPWLNASAVTTVGLLVGALLAIVGLVASPRRLGRAIRVTAVCAVAAISLLALPCVRSVNPLMSLVGLVGQHNGLALWVLCGLWLLVGIACADSRALRATLVVLVIAGAVFCTATLREIAVSGFSRPFGLGFAAGQFDNSTSLGEFLGISVIASLSLAVASRRSWEKAIFYFAAVLLAAGILVSQARTGLVGVLAGVVFAAAAANLPRSRAMTAAAVATPPTLGVLATGFAVAASNGALGTGAEGLVSSIGSSRDILWRSAWAQIQQAPLFGSGLEHFSAWTLIGAKGGAATFDPHNVLLAITLGGGIVGLIAVGAAFAALLWALCDAINGKPRALGLALAASMPVVLLGEGLVAWLAPAAALAAFSVTGALLGASIGSRKLAGSEVHAATWDRRVGRCGLGILGGAAIVLGALAAFAIPTMRVYIATQQSPNPTALATAYHRWPDPRYAVLAIRQLAPDVSDPTAAETLRSMLSRSTRDASWRVDLAAVQIEAVETMSGTDPASFSQIVALARQGARADPTSGLWPTLLALDANRLGLADEARIYATQAMTYPLPADLIALLQPLLKP